MPHGHGSAGPHGGHGFFPRSRLPSTHGPTPTHDAAPTHALLVPSPEPLRCEPSRWTKTTIATGGVGVVVAACALQLTFERRGRAAWQRAVAEFRESSADPYRGARVAATHRRAAPPLVRAAALSCFALSAASVVALATALGGASLDAFTELLFVAAIVAVALARCGALLLSRTAGAASTIRGTAGVAAAIGAAIGFLTYERHTTGCSLSDAEVALAALTVAWVLVPAMLLPAARLGVPADAAGHDAAATSHA